MKVGYAFIKVKPPKEREIFDKFQPPPEVIDLQPHFDEYNLIAKVEVEDAESLESFAAEKIKNLPGVVKVRVMGVGDFLGKEG